MKVLKAGKIKPISKHSNFGCIPSVTHYARLHDEAEANLYKGLKEKYKKY